MKIGIVGSGMVGATAAYAMVMKGVGRKIVLVDKDTKRCQAEVEDINHAVPFSHPLVVVGGDYSDLKGSRLVIISAGVSQKPGESRLDLLKRNAAVFKQVVPSILTNAPEAAIVVATNPVDIMTHLAAKYAGEVGVPKEKVIGSGTTLDTARFRSLLGDKVGVDPHNVHAYVIGEHGDSEVLTWSLVRIGAMTLDDFCGRHDICMEEEERKAIDKGVREAAYTIIEGKGATYYGIGSALAKIVDVILHDQRCILTVSTPAEDVAGIRDVCVSMPRLVGGEGILGTFPLPLDGVEEQALKASAQVVKEATDALESTT
jgi:L-lactate dehydrogenase